MVQSSHLSTRHPSTFRRLHLFGLAAVHVELGWLNTSAMQGSVYMAVIDGSVADRLQYEKF